MLDRCDVLVVGAGPAGSTAARYAAEAGLDVLLIDKRKEIGVPVCCGEFNASLAVLAEALPNAPGLDELFPIDPGLVRRKIRGAVAVSPGGREYEFDLPGYTVDRDAFDRHLADAAVREGAVLSPDTMFLERDGRRVTTSRGAIKANVVVAADGPLSRVCRSAGMERSAVLAPAITCRVDGEFGDRLRFFFGSSVAPGGMPGSSRRGGAPTSGLACRGRQRPSPSFSGRSSRTTALPPGISRPVSSPSPAPSARPCART